MSFSALRSEFVPANLDWLTLRFKYDSYARHVGLHKHLLQKVNGRDLRILDLGSGSAANVLHLAGAFNAKQHWTLVDRDSFLLHQVAVNLQSLLSSASQEPSYEIFSEDFYNSDARCFSKVYDLVVANAVFDLNSMTQFRLLIRTLNRTQPRSTLLYFTLNLDTDLQFHPLDSHDHLARDLFHKHMCRRQHFGRAMGPKSAKLMASTLETFGYRVKVGPSPWVAQSDSRFIDSYLDFMQDCRTDFSRISEEKRKLYDAWLLRRKAQNLRGELSLRVGHLDIFAERP